jgi:hypothetical protein
MTSRERVNSTLNHKEPDRVLILLDGTFATTITECLISIDLRGIAIGY